jgi:uncharacterized protein (DUF433 family)
MVEAVIRGTRITVDLVTDLLAQGWMEQDLLAPTRISRARISSAVALCDKCSYIAHT